MYKKMCQNERRNKKFKHFIRSSDLACVAKASNHKDFGITSMFIKDFSIFIK